MTYQWHIFVAVLDPTRGSEQAGRRPVLVVSREEINQLLSVVNVIPLTSQVQGTHHLSQRSAASSGYGWPTRGFYRFVLSDPHP
jgi:mRNA-degrading endonuclease toxin of MazEF toxin-antitoxin module